MADLTPPSTWRRTAPLAGQGPFLQALGIAQRAAALSRKGDPAAIRAQAERLVAPDQMGTLFKVLGVAAPTAPPLPGLEG